MTVDAFAAVFGLAAQSLWLSLVTVEVRRLRRDVGEPVFRRLPDGRIRYQWIVNVGFEKARSQAAEQARARTPSQTPTVRARATQRSGKMTG
ncbi:hypothetical protein [Pseudonocardia acaciae]|uniref:hypothetical protein n=1 Tax=Pseudonocardia acaciae TaxID=551276 RepID=UPI00048AF00D|nr:hypothetical protein [Pseudonocardia acaciae]